MAVARLAGQGASSRKYDVLTAIGAAGLAGEAMAQRLALRLIVLITARYDWRADRLATGQREIAALWSVDERTVKREMARLREKGWLVLRRQGGRGRVAEYALGLDRILADTAPHWAAVGRDLEARLAPDDAPPVPAGTPNIIAFPQPDGQSPWDRVMQHIAQEAPTVYATWLRQLRPLEETGGGLTLEAPTRFHANYVETHLALRILTACRVAAPQIGSLRILVAG
ncbi:DnaA N-terminal domain-containing protein [Falsirhodobacter deserti]|uniref:DnaA N-terminal domain-containing protein n=1 Tax=Falsirhodobacter deserti TaxID=1365611 RepID=UPI000FE42E39|nr:DnaA N-terminal domain-containing protein [Falsirhodobacter deserti]